MTPTPPNPAAAQVERIVRECAETLLPKVASMSDRFLEVERKIGAPIIHRAIAEAIAATGAREALETIASYTYEDDQCYVRPTQEAEIAKEALANLDAVMGKKP